METDKLSDQQLYSAICNNSLAPEIRDALEKEFEKRNFSISYVDELALKHEGLDYYSDIPKTTKVILILFPFMPILQAIFANQYLKRRDTKAWKQYWHFVFFGWLF